MTLRDPRAACALLGLMAISACANQGATTSDVIAGTYTCDDGKTFSFTTATGSETLTLELDGQSYPLQQEQVAGRAQYGDGTLAFWTNGGGRFANLEGTTETYSNCVASAWQGGGLGQEGPPPFGGA